MIDHPTPPTSDTAARLDRVYADYKRLLTRPLKPSERYADDDRRRKDRPEMLSDRLGYDTSVGDDDWERIAATSDDDRRRIIAQVRGTVDAWHDRSLTSFRAMVAIERIVGGETRA